MSSSKPVICLVHGAWHQPLHYGGLINPLRREGYTVLAPPLASTGTDEEAIQGKTIKDDKHIILQNIEPHMNDGHEIVIACHSYGALVATEVAVGQSVAERALKGLSGGISGVVFISAILFPEVGMNSWDILFGGGAKVPLWLDVHDKYIEVNTPLVFYNDVDKLLAEVCSLALVKQSVASTKSGIRHAASEVKARKIFVVCKKAENNPVEAQLIMANSAGAEIEELDCGHSPFLVDEHVHELARIIKGA